jgi:hypothetical protein
MADFSGEDNEPQLSPFDSRLYRSRYRNGWLLNTRAVGTHQQELEREYQRFAAEDGR